MTGNSSTDSAVGAIAGAVIGATMGSALENQALGADATEYILEDYRSDLMTIVFGKVESSSTQHLNEQNLY